MPGTNKNVQEITCEKCEKNVSKLGNFISVLKFRMLGISLEYIA